MTTSQTTAAQTTAAQTASASRAGRLTWWQALGTAALGATVVNLVVLGIADLAGASLVLADQGAPYPITVGGVIFSSTVPLLVGAGLAVLLALWWPAVIRVAQVVGGGLALLSVAGPVLSQTDGATQFALAVMHVVVGVAVVLGLQAVRNSGTRRT